jgi:hypothetical protein
MRKNENTFAVPAGTSGLTTLLQKGVFLRGRSGISIREFLEHHVGMDAEYIEKDVRTIFLNSAPVDDIDTIKVDDGDVLSLSAAMPGLVGIAMGRNTLVSGFRSDISAKAKDVDDGDAFVLVKLFNLVARDAGSSLLQRGVWVPAKLLAEVLPQSCPPESVGPDDRIFLRVE